MTWLRLLCLLLFCCSMALGVGPSAREAADPASVPLSERLLRAGLDPAVVSTIQSDVSKKAFSKAEAELIGQINVSSHPSALLEVLGGVFFLDANYLQAAVAYKKAEKYSPLSENAQFTLVMSYIKLKRNDWARDDLLRLIESRPGKALYPYWLGRLDYDRQNFAAGLASFDKAIGIDNRFVRAYEGKGLCDEAIGDTASAEQSYRTANVLNREQGSHNAWPPLDYGAMLAKLGRYAEAASLLNEALAIDPSSAKAHYELGRVQDETSRTGLAIQNFAAAAALDPADPAPLYALFRLYRKTGRKELAAQAIARFRILKGQASQ